MLSIKKLTETAYQHIASFVWRIGQKVDRKDEVVEVKGYNSSNVLNIRFIEFLCSDAQG